MSASPDSTAAVFIAFQANDETRSIVSAIVRDNPEARIADYPAMVKIDAPGQLCIRRTSIEDELGRRFDLRELHVNLISLAGNIDESDDEFVLRWNA
jgi:phenol/toluene 2-monooxygenase (NADH) P2/A2